MKLVGSKIFVRFLEMADAQAMFDLQLRNREFFQAYAAQPSAKLFYRLFYGQTAQWQRIDDRSGPVGC